ncbi:MAG: lpdA [Alphaproteobacteria bacterium]|nr:lpdA [Alphaproteobacteria bacterium]
MTEQKFDIVVIGGGPGGYVHAIKAAQLGMKVAVVEKNTSLGGTCLNVGCIPSKALLTATHDVQKTKHDFDTFGIELSGVNVNLQKMMKFKQDVVTANTKGVDFLFKKNKIERIKGVGALKDAGTVTVIDDGKTSEIAAKYIVIATGSASIDIPNVPVDEKRIVTSTGALELEKIPATMIVIGGGVIGLEMASVWSRLGTKVTIVEYLDRILPGMDNEVSKEMLKLLTKQGLEFKFATKVTGAKVEGSGVTLTAEPAAGGAAEILNAEIVLVAIGRKPYTDGLNLDAVGVKRDERGRILVDQHFETNIEGVYAIGDVIPGPMLAHKAEDEGFILAEMLAGQTGHIDYNLVPGVVYTFPEAASIGQTEEQLKKAGIEYKAGKFPMMANGRARSINATEGFVKILADAKTDKVLGAHIVAAEAGTLIHEVAVLMEFGGSSEDLARTCHAHPTLNEAVREAALATFALPLHI